jgi:hypothetical protein
MIVAIMMMVFSLMVVTPITADTVLPGKAKASQYIAAQEMVKSGTLALDLTHQPAIMTKGILEVTGYKTTPFADKITRGQPVLGKECPHTPIIDRGSVGRLLEVRVGRHIDAKMLSTVETGRGWTPAYACIMSGAKTGTKVIGRTGVEFRIRI